MPHKLKKCLLFDVVLNFTLQHFYMILLDFNSVLVHFALKLHAWKNLLRINLKVLQLFHDSGMLFLLR